MSTHDGTLLDALKRSRENFLDTHSDSADWASRLFSGTTHALWTAARAAMREHCRGLVLDAGSGRGSWRGTILSTATGYESIDIAPRGDHAPTWTGDVCSMQDVPDDRYDTVVCHQVLEHLRTPWLALGQMHRVLKPGGTIIVSAPHLSRRHELPHDYFRFTQEGLLALLSDARFSDRHAFAYGGMLSFLHHQASMIIPGLVSGVPVIGMVALALNAPVSWAVARLDDVLDAGRLMPTGVIGVARKQN